ncbi:MAG TPA: hypothetical protein PK906_17955 [Spirochaetota bacterium]|nr:hypothetical protein [Spirochaetota bacterium]
MKKSVLNAFVISVIFFSIIPVYSQTFQDVTKQTTEKKTALIKKFHELFYSGKYKTLSIYDRGKWTAYEITNVNIEGDELLILTHKYDKGGTTYYLLSDFYKIHTAGNVITLY